MFKKILFFNLIILIASCNDGCNINRSQNKTINSSAFNIKEDSIFIYDTTGKSQSERLNKLIEISCLKRFDQSKKSWQILLFQNDEYKILSTYTEYSYTNAFGITSRKKSSIGY